MSSTAHLNGVRYLLGEPADLSTDTALHLGSLLATGVWVFQQQQHMPVREPAFWVKVLCATVPAGLTGLAIEKPLARWRTPRVTAAMLVLGGLGLFVSERFLMNPEKRSVSLNQLSCSQATAVGFSQALALFPGVSRSGMTQMAGQWAGLSPVEAQRFSFVLALPIVSASALYESRHLSAVQARQLIPGIIGSGITSLLMLQKVQRFAEPHWQQRLGLYRCGLGVLTYAYRTLFHNKNP